MAPRHKTGSSNGIVHFPPQKRDASRARALGRGGKETHEDPFAHHPTGSVKALQRDRIHVHRAVNPGARTATLLPQSYLRPNLLEDNELIRADLPELSDATRTTSLIFTDFPGLNPLAKRIVERAKTHFAQALWK